MGAHRLRTRAVVAALAVAGMVAGAGPPAAATSSPTGPNRQAASVGSAQPPAQSNIIAAALYSLTDPTMAPPGANNWNCRPSAAHPYPVLLSNGTTENAYENWAGMAPALAAAGYCVFTVNAGGAPGAFLQTVGPIADTAAQLATFGAEVLQATGATKLDVAGPG